MGGGTTGAASTATTAVDDSPSVAGAPASSLFVAVSDHVRALCNGELPLDDGAPALLVRVDDDSFNGKTPLCP